MKLSPLIKTRNVRRGEEGLVTLVVLVFLTIMVVYLVSNNVALNNLKQGLRVVEKKQLKKYEHGVIKRSENRAGALTNRVAVTPLPAGQ